jgi:hypothetical protein
MTASPCGPKPAFVGSLDNYNVCGIYYIMASASSRSGANWLLLILTLPGRQASLRMRIWRGLQAVGAGVLRGMRARIRDDQPAGQQC